MERLFTLALVLLFAAAVQTAFARSPKLAPNSCSQNSEAIATNIRLDGGTLAPASARRDELAWQAMSMHGVWYRPAVYLQFYADPDLVAYLTEISQDLIVLAVYSSEPIHFRRGEVVFVSTGFILQLRSEAELLEAMASDGVCALRPGDAARFSAAQAKLALGIGDYYETTRSPLRCREITPPPQLRRR
jgi:hypothetical protein